jgi:outer membrane protein
MNINTLGLSFDSVNLDFGLQPTAQSTPQNMLRITTENKKGRLILSVEGRLAGQWVGALEQCWRELLAATPRQKFSIDLCGVSYIDSAGKVLLREMHGLGGELIAEGCLNQAIVNEIVGEQEKAEASQKKEKDAKDTKGTTIIFYIALLSLLIFPTVMRAQSTANQPALPANAPTGVLRFTLEQAVNLGLKQNPTQQIAVLIALESIQDKNITRSEFLPQANLQVADSANRVNIDAQFGGKLPPQFPFPEHIGPYQVFSAGPTFGSSVIDLSLWKRYQASKADVGAAKANSLSTREQVILLIVSQYIGTLRAVANVTASRSRVDLAQALYDQAADLQKEGVGTGIDTLRANVELQNEKQRLIEAENDRDQSLFGLNKLLNLDPRQKLELADALSFFETPQPDVDISLNEALADRQEWKAIEYQEKSLAYEKQSAEYSRLPALRFDGNWAYLGTSATNGIPTYVYQASAVVPLFTSGRIKAQIAKSNIELQKLEQQKDDLRNQIALDVKTSLLNLSSARSEVQVANLGVQLAQQEVQQAGDRFRAGVANNIEVISAQDSLSRANDNQILALYRFNQARADYARSVGQMEKTYK